MKDKKYYDEFFKKNSAEIHNDPDRFLKISELCEGNVLDLACGTGNLADYFRGAYTGVDISDIAIFKAREIRREDTCFFVADLLENGFATSTKFDSVVVSEFLEHINNDESLFENIKNIITPNGKIICSVPNGLCVPDESHCRIFTIPQIRREYSKYGKVRFHNWTGERKRIIFSIEPDSSDMNYISLVMCVKDEEKGIENAILSTISLVDRIVISVDSATTDKTKEIAKLYADELKTHEWHDNFSEMRNLAGENVKSKWILFLDGHEYLEKIGDVKSKLLLDIDGINITVKMENGSSFMYPRIYKNGLKFENAVHNAINCKTIQYEPKFVIVHDRNNAQSEASIKARETQRNRMIPKLMKEVLNKEPNDQRALFNLGNWYMTKLDFKFALYYYKKCIKFTPSRDEKYFLQAQIGIAFLLSGHELRALWSFQRLEKLIPNRWETRRLIGGAYMQTERFKKALPFLVEALELPKKQYIYQLFGQDFCELWDLIGFCFFSLEQYPECIVAWEKAIEATNDKKRKDFFKTRLVYVKMLK